MKELKKLFSYMGEYKRDFFLAMALVAALMVSGAGSA